MVTIAQLRAAGVSDAAVKGRVRSGRLHRVHRGVYALGHGYLSQEGRWMAAVLASGGALSHRSAATLWGLLPPKPGPSDVSVTGTGGRSRRAGIRLHRSRTLTMGDVTKRRGIPVTTPTRTIADLRAASRARRGEFIAQREVRRAIRQAGVLGLRIGGAEEGDRTRSELEHLFLRLCEQHELPAPEVNVRIGRFLVDFLWHRERLIVETDGYRYHSDRAAFEQDRNRDLELKSLGYDVIRLSYRQVTNEPDRIAGTLAGLLASGDQPTPPSRRPSGRGALAPPGSPG